MTGSFKLILILFFCVCVQYLKSEERSDFHIVFYNVENLYDTWDDPSALDEDFTPSGIKHWTHERFREKLLTIFKSIITACDGNFPDLIGLAEVENRYVIEQLISLTPLRNYPYQIIHKESPDPRGIDVAILYRKDRIIPANYDFITIGKTGKKGFVSRDILYFAVKIKDNKIHFFINHWPSRSDGYLETKEKRNIAAKILRSRVDSIINKEHYPSILILGDFNATPNEKCLKETLKVSSFGHKVANHLVNLSSKWSEGKYGTIFSKGTWEIFDQIICSENLLISGNITLEITQTKICNAPFLLERDRNSLLEKPFRTYLGPVYHGGVSDHLPVVTVLTCHP